MKGLVECVPNFSEGRRRDVVEEILKAITSTEGVHLLGYEMDGDHNRAVVTFVGESQAVRRGAFRGIEKARDLIDLRKHRGAHPRMGAADVVPLVPLEGTSMEACVKLARDLGREVGERLGIPVFLYEEAATRPDRRSLSNIRKGEFEGLSEEMGKKPGRKPDFGPERIHPTAGAVAIGARPFLIAFNVNLDSPDVRIAKQIAREIRETSGGLPNVKALGFMIEERGVAQISMNLTNFHVTPILRAFEEIEKRAKAAGAGVLESELIGLVPRTALNPEWIPRLKLRNFRGEQIIEVRVKQVMEREG